MVSNILNLYEENVKLFVILEIEHKVSLLLHFFYTFFIEIKGQHIFHCFQSLNDLNLLWVVLSVGKNEWIKPAVGSVRRKLIIFITFHWNLFFLNMYSKKPTVFSITGLGRGTFLSFASFYYPLVDRFFCFLSFEKIKWKEARVTI